MKKNITKYLFYCVITLTFLVGCFNSFSEPIGFSFSKALYGLTLISLIFFHFSDKPRFAFFYLGTVTVRIIEFMNTFSNSSLASFSEPHLSWTALSITIGPYIICVALIITTLIINRKTNVQTNDA